MNQVYHTFCPSGRKFTAFLCGLGFFWYEQKAESILLTLLYKVNALHTLARNLMQLIAPARRRPERVPRRRLPPHRPAERRTPLRSSSSISRCSTPASSPRRSLRRRSARCSASEKA